jgi:hypothetical protein
LEAARDRAIREKARADKYERAYWAVSQLHVWTNEDGKRFVFADDLAAALEVPGTSKEDAR